MAVDARSEMQDAKRQGPAGNQKGKCGGGSPPNIWGRTNQRCVFPQLAALLTILLLEGEEGKSVKFN